MSRRSREPRTQRASRFDRSVRSYTRRLGVPSAWLTLANTQTCRRLEPTQPPGERNGLYGARCVPKQKIGDFERVRGIEPQTRSERQILSARRVKKYGFGVNVDWGRMDRSPYPSAMPRKCGPMPEKRKRLQDVPPDDGGKDAAIVRNIRPKPMKSTFRIGPASAAYRAAHA